MISVVPNIEPRSGGFLLKVRAIENNQVWQKWYEHELDAYTEASDIGLAHDEFIGSTHLRTLNTQVLIDTQRLEEVGFQKL